MNYHNNKNEESEILIGLGITKSFQPYQLPGSYFENLPAEILFSVKAAFSENDPDANLFSRNNIFSVPEGYFDSLTSTILDKTREAEQVIMDGKYSWGHEAKTLPYHLPEDYFAHFEQQLTQKIFHSESELEELPSLLSSLQKTQPLSVPEDYFTQDIQPVVKAEAEAKPKIIEHPSVKSIRWANWAAAAVVVLILGMGGWHFLGNTNNIAKPSFEQKLAQIPKSDVQSYINNNLEEFDVNMIENSISQATKNDMAASALSGVSDAEIEAYLNGDI